MKTCATSATQRVCGYTGAIFTAEALRRRVPRSVDSPTTDY